MLKWNSKSCQRPKERTLECSQSFCTTWRLGGWLCSKRTRAARQRIAKSENEANKKARCKRCKACKVAAKKWIRELHPWLPTLLFKMHICKHWIFFTANSKKKRINNRFIVIILNDYQQMALLICCTILKVTFETSRISCHCYHAIVKSPHADQ